MFTILNCFIEAVIWVLFFFILFLLGLLLVIRIEGWCDSGISFLVTGDRIQEYLQFWTPYKSIIKLLGKSLTLLVVTYTLRQYIKVETINALSMIRSKLNTEEKKDIHYFLMDEEDRNLTLEPKNDAPTLSKPNNGGGSSTESPVEESHIEDCQKKDTPKEESPQTPGHQQSVEIFDYLGTIELGAKMIREGVISKEDFFQQFGYRVENIVKNIVKNEILRKHIQEDRKYYDDFYYIARVLDLNL